MKVLKALHVNSNTVPKLHNEEEKLKSAFRDQVAELAALLEVFVSILVLLGLLFSIAPIFAELKGLIGADNAERFHHFLEDAFTLVIGIEFIKMLAKHSPGSVLEVLLCAIARHMVLGNNTAVDNLLAVLSIGLIFVIRKFFFVPSFGSGNGVPAPKLKEIIQQMRANAAAAPDSAPEQDKEEQPV